MRLRQLASTPRRKHRRHHRNHRQDQTAKPAAAPSAIRLRHRHRRLRIPDQLARVIRLEGLVIVMVARHPVRSSPSPRPAGRGRWQDHWPRPPGTTGGCRHRPAARWSAACPAGSGTSRAGLRVAAVDGTEGRREVVRAHRRAGRAQQLAADDQGTRSCRPAPVAGSAAGVVHQRLVLAVVLVSTTPTMLPLTSYWYAVWPESSSVLVPDSVTSR